MNAVSGKTSMRMRYSELYSNVKRLAEKISPLAFLRKSLSNSYLTTTTPVCLGIRQVARFIKGNALT